MMGTRFVRRATRAVTLLAAAMASTGMLALASPALDASAAPLPASIAAEAVIDCTPVPPATFTSSARQPETVWVPVEVVFEGSFDTQVSPGSCVVIAANAQLPLITRGDYPS